MRYELVMSFSNNPDAVVLASKLKEGYYAVLHKLNGKSSGNHIRPLLLADG